MDKNYEFKDLSVLSEEEKREEILNFFSDINVPYNQLKVAESIYNYCKNRGSNLYYYIAKIIIKNFNEEDVAEGVIDENINTMIRVYKWINKICLVPKNGDGVYHKVFEFCKNNNLTSGYGVKDFLIGIKNLLMYCNCESDKIYFDSKTLENLLDNITTKKECQTLIENTRHMEQIQNTFRYLLENKYPDNQKGLVKTMINCFKSVKQHQRKINPEFDESDPTKPISMTSLDALYSMAYLYEKLLSNIKEKDSLPEGEKRFADSFITEFAKMYAQHSKVALYRDIIYDFNELLKFLNSDNLSEEERFSDEELKSFLLNNVKSVLGIDLNVDDLIEKRRIINGVIDYANTDADEKVTLKNLLNTINPSMVYSHTEIVNEQMKLLMGETLGDAYGQDKDPLSENEYRFYLRALEVKDLFGDVAIQNVTPEGLNKLIRENPDVCNTVRCTVIQMMLSKMIDYLFYVFDLDDGNDYYTNDKIAMLDNIGIDINQILTIENLPYLCNFKIVYNMRKEDDSIIWYDFCENIKTLKSYYLIDEIVDIIKYHPEVVFSDHNELYNYVNKYNIQSLYNGLEINPNFGMQ